MPRLVVKLLVGLVALIAASRAAEALVRVDVDLSSQTMTVDSATGGEHVWAISSGRAGHLTPRGLFRPQAMYVMAHSAKCDDAPMPHSIFFTGGYAIHGTNAVGHLGRPASHGCVRLAPQNAALLFRLVRAEGARIRIEGSTPARAPFAERHRRGRAGAASLGRRRHHRDSLLAYTPHERRQPERALWLWTLDSLER